MKEFTAVKELSEKLLEDYKTESSFFFTSPTRTILAEGEFTTVKHHEIESFPELVQAVLCNAKQAGNPNPIVVGALPFDRRKEVQLIVPEYSRTSERLQLDTTNQLEINENLTFEMTPVPAPEVYMNGVKQGIAKIKGGDLKKNRSIQIVRC